MNMKYKQWFNGKINQIKCVSFNVQIIMCAYKYSYVWYTSKIMLAPMYLIKYTNNTFKRSFWYSSLL